MTLQEKVQKSHISYAFSLDDLVQQLDVLIKQSDETYWHHAFFRMPRVRDLFQTLDNFVHHDDGIILISGAHAIGKTSLLKICANSWRNDPQLLCSLKLSQTITTKIKAAKPEADLLKTIKTWNWSTAAENRKLIFLFDDIDRFSLNEFSRFEALLHSPVSFVDKMTAVTFGDFGKMNGDLQKLFHTHRLKTIPFNTYTLMDVEILLFNVLRRFGVPSATYVFSHDVLEWLCTESKGLPGQVIKLAQTLLQLGAGKGYEFIDWSVVEYYKSKQTIRAQKQEQHQQIKSNAAIKQLFSVEKDSQAHKINNMGNGRKIKNAHAALVKQAMQNPVEATADYAMKKETPDKSLSQQEIDRLLAGFLAGETLQQTRPKMENQASQKEPKEADELTQELLDKLITEHEKRNGSKKQKKQAQQRFVVKTRKGDWNPLPAVKKKSLFPKKSKNICYMDIGTNAIKFLLANKDGQIEHSKIFPTNQETAEDIVNGTFSHGAGDQIIASLKSFAQLYLNDGDDLAISLSGKYLLSLNLNFPEMSAKELDSAIKLEIEGKHHLFPNQEKIIKYKIQQLSTDRMGERNVYCTVIQKNVVDRILSLTESPGFNVSLLTVNSNAIHNYLLRTGVLDNTDATVIIDIGSHISELLIVQGSKILLSQKIHVGSFMFNQSISDALMVDYGLAEEFKIKLGSAMTPQEKKVIDTTDNIEVYEALAPVLEQLDGEIGRAIESHRLRHPETLVREIILTGGGSRLSRLDARLSANFSLPVIRLDAPRGLKISEEQQGFDALEFLPALGLLLGFGQEDNAINLVEKTNPIPRKKKKTAAKKHISQNYDSPLNNKWQNRVLFAFFILFLSFMLFNIYIEKMENKSLAVEDILNENSTKITELNNLIKQNRTWKEQIQIIENLKQKHIRYSETLDEIIKLKPQNISISSISMLDGRLIIDGVAKSSDLFPSFLKSLSHLADFNQPELRSINKNIGQGTSYQIVCKPTLPKE